MLEVRSSAIQKSADDFAEVSVLRMHEYHLKTLTRISRGHAWEQTALEES